MKRNGPSPPDWGLVLLSPGAGDMGSGETGSPPAETPEPGARGGNADVAVGAAGDPPNENKEEKKPDFTGVGVVVEVVVAVAVSACGSESVKTRDTGALPRA